MIRILHVEDNKNDLDLLRMQFTRVSDNFSMTGVTSVEEALEIFGREEFDCIICDLQLPRKNGLDMLKAIRSAGVSIPFIFLTGHGNEEIAAEALRMGASDYYSKETNLDGARRLIESIKKHVESHRLKNDFQSIVRRNEQAEETYQQMLEAMETPVVLVDSDLNILKSNPAFRSLFADSMAHGEKGSAGRITNYPVFSSNQLVSAVNQALAGRSITSEKIDDTFGDGRRIRCTCTMYPHLQPDDSSACYLMLRGVKKREPGRKSDSAELEEMLRKERMALERVNEQFRGQLTDRIKFEKIFSLLHDLAKSLTTIRESRQFYQHVCESLGKLINTDNIYIAIHEHDAVFSFPYIKDSHDSEQEKEADLRGSLTDYVFRTGEPQLIDTKRHEELEQKGEVESVIGEQSYCWLGVPLRADDHVFGVLVVQSYDDPYAYTEEDKEILTVISNQFALAIRKKMAEEELMRYQIRLEERVRERTRDLQTMNIQLQKEVELRSKSERVLSSLYKLSRRVITADSLENLLSSIHQEMNLLFSDVDMYIIHSREQGSRPEFIYPEGADDYQTSVKAIAGAVIEDGVTIYAAAKGVENISESMHRELSDTGSSWLAAPLVTNKGVMGAVILRRAGDDGGFNDEEYSLFSSISLNLVQAIEKKVLDDERALLLEFMQEKNEQLQNVNDELEAFSYSVSHDLRKPVRHIHGFTSFISDLAEEREDQELIRLSGKIKKSCANMNELIEDLLTLSRINRVEIVRETVDISQLSRAILHEMQEAEPERQVEVEIEDGLLVEAEPSLTRVLMQNLLDNAWKFTSRKEDAEIQVGSRNKSGKTYISVSDNGAGFDGKRSKEIFAPFTRLHKQKDFAGTGVGLATVARIIHRHGGNIFAEATEEKGATFYFRV